MWEEAAVVGSPKLLLLIREACSLLFRVPRRCRLLSDDLRLFCLETRLVYRSPLLSYASEP